jgi:hypothetical protein
MAYRELLCTHTPHAAASAGSAAAHPANAVVIHDAS